MSSSFRDSKENHLSFSLCCMARSKKHTKQMFNFSHLIPTRYHVVLLLIWVWITGFIPAIYLAILRFKTVASILLKLIPQASFVLEFQVDRSKPMIPLFLVIVWFLTEWTFSVLKSLLVSKIKQKCTKKSCKFKSHMSVLFHSICESHVSVFYFWCVFLFV